MLFAAMGFLVGGLDDLLVDALYIARWILRSGRRRLRLADLPAPARSGRLAVFVAAWDEEAVIGGMLGAAVERFEHPDYRIYVGVYPNDPGTIRAVTRVADRDSRVRMIVGGKPGPTTKADCLNTLWVALCRDDAADGITTKAVILHDAEDVVHAGELRVFDTLIENRAVVQLPVLPLVRRGSLVSGHYADEFAYAHTMQQVVRAGIGAAMPLAGTGCAIATGMLAMIADERGGMPFDATSLTEDYELGLRIGELRGRSLFARVTDERDATTVAVRAYFPDTVPTATRQKARWMTGIALAGWDRTGWGRAHAISDHWMRMRDRRAPLSVLVLAVAYLSVALWGVGMVLHLAMATPAADDRLAGWLLAITTALLGWRLATRFVCTACCYDLREAMWSMPRFFVGNLVSLVAAPRALLNYLRLLRGGAVRWDKTRHEFPDLDQTLPA